MRITSSSLLKKIASASMAVGFSVIAVFANAATPVFELEIRDHLFWPSEITIPANTKVKLLITNSDSTPEEFESYELNREKLITPNNKAIVFIGPLEVGEYPFFGEFFPKTAQGKVIVSATLEP